MLSLPDEVRPMNLHGHKPWSSPWPMQNVGSHRLLSTEVTHYPMEEGKGGRSSFLLCQPSPLTFKRDLISFFSHFPSTCTISAVACFRITEDREWPGRIAQGTVFSWLSQSIDLHSCEWIGIRVIPCFPAHRSHLHLVLWRVSLSSK